MEAGFAPVVENSEDTATTPLALRFAVGAETHGMAATVPTEVWTGRDQPVELAALMVTVWSALPEPVTRFSRARSAAEIVIELTPAVLAPK